MIMEIECPRCHKLIRRCATLRRGRGMVPSNVFYCPSCRLVCGKDGVVLSNDV
jgi:hypothetical protein